MNPQTRRMLACYIRFCLVGGVGLGVDMTLLLFLHHGLGWTVIPAKLVAAEVALVGNFWWNETWTFRGLPACRGGRGPRFVAFHLICLAGVVLGVGFLRTATGGFGWPVWLANLAAILGVSVWNFGLNWCWAWRGARRVVRGRGGTGA